MGIFQRYIKTDKNGNPIIGKDGKPNGREKVLGLYNIHTPGTLKQVR
jgi:hypothetical protein